MTNHLFLSSLVHPFPEQLFFYHFGIGCIWICYLFLQNQVNTSISNDSRNNTALISRVVSISRGESKYFNEILKSQPTDTLKRCYWKIREIFSITFFKQCNNVIIIIYNLFDLQNQLFSKIKFILIFLLTN